MKSPHEMSPDERRAQLQAYADDAWIHAEHCQIMPQRYKAGRARDPQVWRQEALRLEKLAREVRT